MKAFALLLVCVSLVPAWAEGPLSDHQLMLQELRISALRPGADGNNKAALNAANYDETKVGQYVLPAPLRLNDGKPVKDPAVWWKKRRPEIAAAFDDEMYGRLPKSVPATHWRLQGATGQRVGRTRTLTEHFIGAGSEGDQWVDQRGTFLAAVAAGPVYRLLGQKDLGTDEYPPVDTAIISGALGFRRHAFGHTPQPNWAAFLEFAKNNHIE